jgi:type IV secretion system protein VirB5
MFKFRARLPLVLSFVLCLVAPAAHAQFAVIDVASVVQLVKEVDSLAQQVETAKAQLDQAKSEYAAMTGGRGMEGLLSGAPRNYLPPDWASLQSLTSVGGGSYSALASAAQGFVASNAVLSPTQLAALSASERAQILAQRNSAAVLQATTQQAIATTSARFTSLQQLIEAIPTATDQKAALDLQARIASEAAMLQNEHAKLDVLYQATRAQQMAQDQQIRELAISDIGSFRNLPPMGLAP